MNTSAHPIILSSPSAFGLPHRGEGSNGFVYDMTAQGVLALPLGARIVDASFSDAQWLASNNRVGWQVVPAINGLMPYTKAAQDNLVVPQTGSAFNYAFYQGLPASNSDFGLKQVILKVDGADSQKAYIQTFFPTTGWNHPMAGTTSITPNWFYYYSQLVSPSPAVYGNQGTSETVFAENPKQPNGDAINPLSPMTLIRITIGNDAYSIKDPPVFVKNPNTQRLEFHGRLNIKGIHTFVNVLYHEFGHVLDAQNGRLNTKFRESVSSGLRGLDMDSDGVPNVVELDNGLNPNDPDTTGIGIGDAEVLANIHGLKALLSSGVRELWQQDWSDMGLNYSSLEGEAWGPHSVEQAPFWNSLRPLFHPWDYEEASGSIFTPRPFQLQGVYYNGLYHYPIVTSEAVKEVVGHFP